MDDKIKILITRPMHDEVTNYLANWSIEVINEINLSSKFEVLDLKDKKANRNNLEMMIKKQKPSFIFINGHGNYDEVTGHNFETIIKVGENEDKIKTNIMYTLSCNAGKILGPTLIKNNVKAYIGYKERFNFITSKKNTCRPLKDEYAYPFKQSSNIIPISLIKGHSLKETYEKSQEEFDRMIEKFQKSDAPVGSEHIIACLMWNKHNQIILGETDIDINE